MQYVAEDAFIHDFEILFANARHYNEEDSQVYQDSITLEKVLRKKKRMLGAVNSGKLNSLLVKRNVDLLSRGQNGRRKDMFSSGSQLTLKALGKPACIPNSICNCGLISKLSYLNQMKFRLYTKTKQKIAMKMGMKI